MKVAQYIEKCGLETTVLHALETMNVREDLQTEILNALYDFDFKVNTRAKSRFGQINFTKRHIELTSEFFFPGSLMLQTDRKAKHDDTLLHEVAHLITRILFPYARRAHGTHWQLIMRHLGIKNPQATDHAEFLEKAASAKNAVRGYKHHYTCNGCGFTWKTNRKWKRVAGRYHGPCGMQNGQLTHTQLR